MSSVDTTEVHDVASVQKRTLWILFASSTGGRDAGVEGAGQVGHGLDLVEVDADRLLAGGVLEIVDHSTQNAGLAVAPGTEQSRHAPLCDTTAQIVHEVVTPLHLGGFQRPLERERARFHRVHHTRKARVWRRAGSRPLEVAPRSALLPHRSPCVKGFRPRCRQDVRQLADRRADRWPSRRRRVLR